MKLLIQEPGFLWSSWLKGLLSRAIAGPGLDFVRAYVFAVSQLLPSVDSKQLQAVGLIFAIGGNQELSFVRGSSGACITVGRQVGEYR